MLLPFVYHTIPPCKNRSINQSNDLERVFKSRKGLRIMAETQGASAILVLLFSPLALNSQSTSSLLLPSTSMRLSVYLGGNRISHFSFESSFRRFSVPFAPSPKTIP